MRDRWIERECAQERNRKVIGSGEVRATLWDKKHLQNFIVLMALLSHIDLYYSCLGISQGLPDTAQGFCNSLWSYKIKSKDKSNGKFFYFICSHSGHKMKTHLVCTVDR